MKYIPIAVAVMGFVFGAVMFCNWGTSALVAMLT